MNCHQRGCLCCKSRCLTKPTLFTCRCEWCSSCCAHSATCRPHRGPLQYLPLKCQQPVADAAPCLLTCNTATPRACRRKKKACACLDNDMYCLVAAGGEGVGAPTGWPHTQQAGDPKCRGPEAIVRHFWWGTRYLHVRCLWHADAVTCYWLKADSGAVFAFSPSPSPSNRGLCTASRSASPNTPPRGCCCCRPVAALPPPDPSRSC